MSDKLKITNEKKSFSVKVSKLSDDAESPLKVRIKRNNQHGINFSSVKNRVNEEIESASKGAEGLKKTGAKVKGFFKGMKKVIQHSANKRLGKIKTEDVLNVDKQATEIVKRTDKAQTELNERGFKENHISRDEIINSLQARAYDVPNADPTPNDVHELIHDFAKDIYPKEIFEKLKPETDYKDIDTLLNAAIAINKKIEDKKSAKEQAAQAAVLRYDELKENISAKVPNILEEHFSDFTKLAEGNQKLTEALTKAIKEKLLNLHGKDEPFNAEYLTQFNEQLHSQLLEPLMAKLQEHVQERVNKLTEEIKTAKKEEKKNFVNSPDPDALKEKRNALKANFRALKKAITGEENSETSGRTTSIGSSDNNGSPFNQ